MRGGRSALVVSALLLYSCAVPPEPPAAPAEPPPSMTPRLPAVEAQPVSEPAPLPVLEGPPGGGLKPGTAPVAAEVEPRPAGPEVLRLQREVVAQNPSNEAEKLRLSLLLAAGGQLEEAERIFSTLKGRSSGLAPYLDLYLKRELGAHPEAAKVLAELNEAERRAAGFVIERAQLCTKVKRFREFTPAESDRVKPGGVVLVYVEPRNFTLQRQQDRYILHLKYDWKLVDDRSAEHPVKEWDQAPPADREDRITYAGPVQEFYQSFRLPLPENLAMGHYRIKVTVTDPHAGKSDQVYVPIYVTAAEKGR